MMHTCVSRLSNSAKISSSSSADNFSPKIALISFKSIIKREESIQKLKKGITIQVEKRCSEECSSTVNADHTNTKLTLIIIIQVVGKTEIENKNFCQLNQNNKRKEGNVSFTHTFFDKVNTPIPVLLDQEKPYSHTYSLYCKANLYKESSYFLTYLQIKPQLNT